MMAEAEPLIARDLISLTLGSRDPDDHRKFMELAAKRRAQGGFASAAMVNVTIDLSGAISAVTLPQADVVDADDLRPALDALPAPAEAVLDLSDLLAFDPSALRIPAPVALADLPEDIFAE